MINGEGKSNPSPVYIIHGGTDMGNCLCGAFDDGNFCWIVIIALVILFCCCQGN